MARLPQPGADNGTWGSILNDYLSQIHEGDGTLKTDVVTSKSLAPNAVDEAALGATGGLDGQVLIKDSASTGGIRWTTFTGNGTAQVNSDWNATSGVTQILNKPSLAPVATSGSYADLTAKPTIPAAQVQSDWNATTGMGSILNKPTIPAAQVNANWTATSGVAQILNKPTLATVATTGDYNDLINKPAPGSSTPVATTTATGTITLAGDLAGTGGAPTVAKVNGVAVTGTPTAGQVLTAASGTAASWQTPSGGGGGAQLMTYVWANDNGTWPSMPSIGTLSENNMISFIVPPTALPGAVRFPAPPISINSRYVLYYGPTPIASTPSVSVAVTATNGRKVTFKATATLAEGSVSSYTWNFTDSTTVTTSSDTTTHVFPSTGSVGCTVVATDNYNLTGSATTSTTVTEGVPTVTLVGAPNGLDVTWTATATDPEGATLTYAWSGTDSLTGTTATLTKTYTASGTKSATVTVTDDKGSTNTATASVFLVVPDGNGIITADTFTTAAADIAAILNRDTEIGSLGGTAMKPSAAGGLLRISGGVMEWQATQTRGWVRYSAGHMHPRLSATVSATNANSLANFFFDYTNGNITVQFVGDGSITWSKNVTSPAGTSSGTFTSAPAGTWANGDRFEVDIDQATGIITVKQYRSAALLNTHTKTVTAPNVPCINAGIGSGRDYMPLKIDDLVVGVI